jgi:hypothetical protein
LDSITMTHFVNFCRLLIFIGLRWLLNQFSICQIFWFFKLIFNWFRCA